MSIQSVLSRVSTILQTQATAILTIFDQVKNLATRAMQIIQQKIQKIFQILLNPPKQKGDYWKILGIYFSKRFVSLSLIILTFGGYFLVKTVLPMAEGKVWAANLKLDTLKYTRFDGKAKVYDQMGILVFEGNLLNGNPQGEGIQYNSNGKIVYKGNFEEGKYSGQGELYADDGTIIYSGTFKDNLYDGTGNLFNDIGKLIYTGNFAVGQKSGVGTDYNPDTSLKKFHGEYENGVLSGKGIEYNEDGETVHYEGQFKDGAYAGEGKLYSKNALQYFGNFEKGLYNGTGNLYDLDTGSLIYSGEFKDGLYDGVGNLYDTTTSVIIYSGEFSKGKKQGTGKSYDKLGSEQFSGSFRADGIDYIGYLGKTPDDFSKEFGKETYKHEKNNKIIITYTNLDACAVFKVDEEKGEYVCEKIFLGAKEKFMGLSSNSTTIERKNVMGDPFSSINYSSPDYYKTVFSNLEININNLKSIPCDKYVMDNYFVRFYFSDGRTELKCIEICSM